MKTILGMILVSVSLSTVMTMAPISAQMDHIKKYGFDWDFWSRYWFYGFISCLAVVSVLTLIVIMVSIFD